MHPRQDDVLVRPVTVGQVDVGVLGGDRAVIHLIRQLPPPRIRRGPSEVHEPSAALPGVKLTPLLLVIVPMVSVSAPLGTISCLDGCPYRQIPTLEAVAVPCRTWILAAIAVPGFNMSGKKNA